MYGCFDYRSRAPVLEPGPKNRLNGDGTLYCERNRHVLERYGCNIKVQLLNQASGWFFPMLES